jgi:exonuclease III
MINVMTYNVSWEALEGKQSASADMTHCRNADNKCTENIVAIIAQNKPADFILLQEIRLDNDNQAKPFMEKMQELGLSNMRGIGTTVGKYAGIITMYDEEKYKVINVVEGDFISPEYARGPLYGRPYLIVVFQRLVDDRIFMVINLHGPQVWEVTPNKTEVVINTIRSEIDKIGAKNAIIIIGGDFNIDMGRSSTQQTYRQMLDGGLNGFEPEDTCCDDGNAGGYTAGSFDHIAVSRPNTITYEKSPSYAQYWLRGKPMMSDHLPRVAHISIV